MLRKTQNTMVFLVFLVADLQKDIWKQAAGGGRISQGSEKPETTICLYGSADAMLHGLFTA